MLGFQAKKLDHADLSEMMLYCSWSIGNLDSDEVYLIMFSSCRQGDCLSWKSEGNKI